MTTTTATAKQIAYIESLCRQAGRQSKYVEAEITGRSISNIARKGLSAAEASAIIDALTK